MPARRAAGDPVPQGRPRSPAGDGYLSSPEFLSLTYTLPCHLLSRVDEIAEESLKARSEVVADALRLYVKAWRARRHHAEISTVEGFSYRELEVSRALLDADPEIEVVEAPPVSAPVDEAESTPAASSATSADEAPARHRDAGATANEPLPNPSASDGARPATPAKESTGESEPKVETVPARKPEPTPEPAPSTEPDPAEKAEPVAAVAPEVDAEVAAEVEPTRGEAEVEGELEPERVEVAVDDEPDDLAEEPTPLIAAGIGGLDAVDPAAPVRARLREVADEPFASARLRRVLEEIVEDIDRRDHSPVDHSLVVAENARALAEIMGLRGTALDRVELAALAHDLGKACIPDEILSKRRPSPEEMSFIRKYPEFGAELIGLVSSLAAIAPLVAAHQERWNGNGYPDGLQGGDIPIEAQIVAICDVYQVLTNDRHYRPAYTEERALQIIRQNVGTLWNPDMGRRFLKMVQADRPR